MIERDFVLRQIHQLVQALARVLGQKRAGEFDALAQSIDETLAAVFGVRSDDVRGRSREEVRRLCDSGGEFSPELAIALADLLRHDASRSGRIRALWLYEEALASGGAVPMDIYDRISALRDSSEAEGRDEQAPGP
jgi:hypothetical protein